MPTASFLSRHDMSRQQPDMRRLSTDDEVRELQTLLMLLDRAGTPPTEMREDFDRVMASVRRAVQRGELDTEFEPAADGTISMPMLGDPAYLKTAIFWSVALKAPLERVVEACRRTGDGVPEADVQAAIRLIGHEDLMCQTDVFFNPTLVTVDRGPEAASPLMKM
ncbi:MAG: hypothetical protein EOP39_20850 [Rubrivivax sp.]|nr:MAG: hypothetical protein EOP39_20850 [Rubrivivax sp.]